VTKGGAALGTRPRESGAVDVTRLTGCLGWTLMKEAVNENRVWTPVTDSSTLTKPSLVTEGVTEGAAEDVKRPTGDVGGVVFQNIGAVKGVLIPMTKGSLWTLSSSVMKCVMSTGWSCRGDSTNRQ